MSEYQYTPEQREVVDEQKDLQNRIYAINDKLKKDLKEYQDIVFNSAMNRPHPAEAMLKLMSEGHMTIHPKKD